MRIPIAVSLESRDGTVDQDAKVVNGIIEVKGEESFLTKKRPGSVDLGLIRAGVAQLLTYWDSQVIAIQDDYINTGSISSTTTWNASDKGAEVTLSGSNLVATIGVSDDGVRSVVSKSSGKFYWEVTCTTSKYFSIGVANSSASLTAVVGAGDVNSVTVNFNGTILTNGTNATGSSITAFVEGDIIGVALDMDARTVGFNKNNGAFTTVSGAYVPAGDLYAFVQGQGNPASAVTANFGATAFSGTVPAGYTAGLTAASDSFGSSAATALTPTTADLPFSAQDNGSSAASGLLMFKNKQQAWTLDEDGTVTQITDLDYPGTYAVTLTSLTRSGTVATATTAVETIFRVGETVTIAGATPNDYNGAQVITAVTRGGTSSSLPPGVLVTITRSSTTATVTSVTRPHGFTNGQSILISGADQSEYNGVKTITWISATQFSFTVTVTAAAAASPASPATGSPVLEVDNFPYSDMAILNDASDNTAFTININSPAAYGDFAVGGQIVVTTALSGVSGTHTITAVGSAWGVYAQLSFTIAGYAGGTVVGTCSVSKPQVTITSLTVNHTTGLASATTSSAHGLVNYAVISGATQPEYNGGHVVTVTSSTTFTYYINANPTTAESPASPATGTIQAQTTTPITTVTSPSFTFTIAGSPATPATGTITASLSGRLTVPGIVYLDGYFCVMDEQGVIYNSAEDDPSVWNALEHLTAQSESGAGKALFKSINYMVAFKEWSTEFFYNAGNEPPGSPFSPVENAHTLVGCAQGWSVADVSGNLLWVAQEKKQKGRSVYMMRGIEQAKVSTPSIDRILDRDSLAEVYAYGMKLGGHSLYVLTLAISNITLVYDLDSKVWSQWTSLTVGSAVNVTSITRSGTTATVTFAAAHGLSDGDPVLMAGANQSEYNGIFQARRSSSTVVTIEVTGSPATPATGTITGKPYTESYFKFTKYAVADGDDVVLHESDGHLYQLLPTLYQDAGIPINVFCRSSRLDGGSNDRKKLVRVSVIGDSVSDTAMVRWSDDDSSTFSAYRIVDLSALRPELRRCGAFERRSIEYRHVGNTAPTLEALELEIGQ